MSDTAKKPVGPFVAADYLTISRNGPLAPSISKQHGRSAFPGMPLKVKDGADLGELRKLIDAGAIHDTCGGSKPWGGQEPAHATAPAPVVPESAKGHFVPRAGKDDPGKGRERQTRLG